MKISLRVFIVFSLALVVSCGEDEINGIISGMNPNQVSLGQQNAVGTITGSNLTATAVSLGDGILVNSFTVKSASEIEVNFSVSGDAAPGARNITLTTARGNVTGNGALNVQDNKVPKAQFSISPSAGSLTTVFEFDAGSSVDQREAAALSYGWNFGDGATASGKKVKHKFKDLGTFDVSLKVTDEQGGFAVATKGIEVLKNSPPIPIFSVKPGLKGNTNTSFILDGRGSKDPDGRVTDHIWDFDDGTRKKHGSVIEHTYEKQGNYDIALTVVDNKGQLATSEKRVEVEKSTEVVCQGRGSSHPAILRGYVIAVEPGNWAVVNFGKGASCKTHWNNCDDFRKWGESGQKEFFGIVSGMKDRGNGILVVRNSCPLRWPPAIGDDIFLYYKTCSQNSCP